MLANGFANRTDVVGRHSCSGQAVAKTLVTTAIVAIVASVALPIARDHLDSSHTAQAIADIGAIEIAISKYQARNRGELPSNLAEVRVAEWTDPWGRAYQYRNLELSGAEELGRQDYDFSTLNRDYDLFSLGKDGRSARSFTSLQARDDIVRGLSGSFLGRAKDYPK